MIRLVLALLRTVSVVASTRRQVKRPQMLAFIVFYFRSARVEGFMDLWKPPNATVLSKPDATDHFSAAWGRAAADRGLGADRQKSLRRTRTPSCFCTSPGPTRARYRRKHSRRGFWSQHGPRDHRQAHRER